MSQFPRQKTRENIGIMQGRRNTNGVIIQVEGFPRKISTPTAALRFTRSEEQDTKSDQGSSKKCEDFDDVIDHVGSNGKYQKSMLHFAISPISAIQPILAFNAVFMLFTPDHWCSGQDRPMWDDPEEYKLVSIPRVNGTDGIWKYSSCTMFTPNQTEVKCSDSWEYDKTHYERTMTSDNNWVCDQKDIPTFALLSGTVGNAFGTLCLGLLSDVWGRKPTLFLAILANVVFRILSLFAGSNQFVLYITQFCVGLTHSTIYILPALLAAELCDRDHRAEVYATTWTICLVGLAILPIISWMCGNWFLIGLVTAGLGALALFYWPIIPESPRWMLQKSRVDEAADILKKVQDYNNGKKKKKKSGRKTSSVSTSESIASLRELLQQVLNRQQLSHGQHTSDTEEEEKEKGKLSLLFKKKNIAKNMLLLTVCWSMNTLIYSAMTYNAMHMSGSHFKNFFLLAIIEVPSGFFGGYLADTLGRRWTQVLAFLLCTLGCFATSIVVHQREMEILMATFSKLAVTVSFLVTYLQATELLPTELRSTGSGIVSTIGNFIAISAPVIATLSSYSAAYPWIAMGALSTIGMIASAFLPETLNLGLPETVEEANNIGKNDKFWSVTAPGNVRNNKSKKNSGK